jgi:hypothetical protein
VQAESDGGRVSVPGDAFWLDALVRRSPQVQGRADS